MEAAIHFLALYFMPIYAIIFILTLFDSLKKIKEEKDVQGVGFLCAISFALMMWTLSSSILLGAG